MRTGLSAMLVAMLLLGAVAPATVVHPALRCTAPDGVTRFKVPLPHTARANRKLVKEKKDKAPTHPGLFGREARAQGTGAPRAVGPIRLTPVAATDVRSGHAAIPRVAWLDR